VPPLKVASPVMPTQTNATIGMGIIGINPNPSRYSFHIGKVGLIKNSKEHKFSDIMLAAQSCVDAGAKVINIGFSCATVEPDVNRCYKPDWDDQFMDIYDQGVLIIGGAGNTGNSGLSNSLEYPAAYRTVMSVSAVDANNMWYDLSTRNDQVEISAPGRRVVIL
jgi:subtilisin family serine protease